MPGSPRARHWEDLVIIGKISPAASPHPTVPGLWTSTRPGRDVNPAYCSEGGAQRGWADSGPSEEAGLSPHVPGPRVGAQRCSPELSSVPAWGQGGQRGGRRYTLSSPRPGASQGCKSARSILMTTLRGMSYYLLHPFYRWRS